MEVWISALIYKLKEIFVSSAFPVNYRGYRRNVYYLTKKKLDAELSRRRKRFLSDCRGEIKQKQGMITDRSYK